MIDKDTIKAGDWIAAEFHEHHHARNTSPEDDEPTGRVYKISGEVTEVPSGSYHRGNVLQIGPYSLGTQHLVITEHRSARKSAGRGALVVRGRDGGLYGRSGEGQYRWFRLGGDHRVPLSDLYIVEIDPEVVVDANGVNVEAERLREAGARADEEELDRIKAQESEKRDTDRRIEVAYWDLRFLAARLRDIEDLPHDAELLFNIATKLRG